MVFVRFILIIFLSFQTGSADTDWGTLAIASSTSVVQKESPFWVGIRFSLRKGWHITPAGETGGILLTWPPDVQVLEVRWISSKKEGLNELLGLARVKAAVPLTNIKLTAKWTACGEICLPCHTVLTLDFPVPTRDLLSKGLIDQSLEFRPLWGQNLGVILFLAFFGGMLLNFMPCVLPVLSFKLLDLMGKKSRKSLSRQGWFFSAGVIGSFWVMGGVLLTLKGQAVGWGFQLQSPLFVYALAFLFFLMALNLWGVFQIGTFLPTEKAQKWFSWKEGPKREDIQTFFSGSLACLVAAPCSAPFMGTALGFAITQSWESAFLIFTGIGMGVSFPFWLICQWPFLYKRLPKSGAWMETLKQFLGFGLMGAALWFLWIVGYRQETFILEGGFLLAALGAWIVGKGDSLILSSRARQKRKWGGIGLIGTAFCLTLFSLQSPESQGIEWEPYSEERFKKLQKEGKTIFLDFTARWCLTCQLNKISLQSPLVARAFKEKGIIAMQADWTHHDPLITQALAEWGRNSIPLNIVFSKGSIPLILPSVLTPQTILDALLSSQK